MSYSQSLPVRRTAVDNYRWGKNLFAILFLGASTLLIKAGFEDEIRAAFFFSNAALSIYLYFEIWRLLNIGEPFAFLSPPLLASVFYFFLAHILPAVARLWYTNIDNRYESLTEDYWSSMGWQAMLAMLAAMAMWRGYSWSGGFSGSIASMFRSTKLLRMEMVPNVTVSVLAQVLYIFAVLYSISTGTLGMASSEQSRNAQVNSQQFLNLALGIGQLSMFLLLVASFREIRQQRPATGLMALALGALALQALVGILSGFKSQFFMPFAVAGLSYYVVFRRIPTRLAGVAAAMLLISYLIVEPYRAYLNQEGIQGTANANLVSALLASWEDRDKLVQTDVPLLEQIATRSDLNSMTAMGTAYVDSGELSDYDQTWLRDSLFLGPVYAYIPRAIWSNKPIYSSGVWFSNNVMRNYVDQGTSVGMGPVSFLYIVGGPLGVALGFLFLGSLQCLMFRGLAINSAGGIIIYLATATFLVMIPSDFGAGFAGFLQLLPFATVAQYAMLIRTNQHGQNS